MFYAIITHFQENNFQNVSRGMEKHKYLFTQRAQTELQAYLNVIVS